MTTGRITQFDWIDSESDILINHPIKRCKVSSVRESKASQRFSESRMVLDPMKHLVSDEDNSILISS